ncbi:secretion protein HlyD [Prosthecochloris sp. GSB1]|uniref:HlyD family efflux transporter periplasmic adaptor subunit n=1 Tax=Prosthecochloris sp. GSB1 TaxID=281093 RepID=UPI000B8CF0B6|nr:HlyD family efflux transporter periplasmic adaptor subunit [Prosthecochloris sp. GSB1]ASQ90914.1 secretion protein HlyD [Prosthecochloris sp. GSB1]
MNVHAQADLATTGPGGRKNTPPATSDHKSASIRIGIIVLLLGFGGFMLWAALAPLDEGVPCEGTVTISTRSKVVQHLHGGIVHEVHVREGQMVEKNDTLITLADQETLARYREVYQRYLGLRATESRLLAEKAGRNSFAFHPDLVTAPDSVLALEIMETQRELFLRRRTMLLTLKERLRGVRAMVAEGYAPRYQQLELEEKLAEMESRRALEMAEVQVAVDAWAEKAAALSEEVERTAIRSPAAGQVVGLQVQTVGGVISPAQKIMDVVPLDERLLIDVRIAPHLIDRVHVGLPADVRFTSFARSPMLVVEGMIESISRDLLTDPDLNPGMPGATYYLARVSLSPEGKESLGDRELQAGMPVQVVIKTGERTLLTYLLHPLVKRMSASLKEE